ncbi:MAG: hypothetical protein V1494_05555 [Candidatus Diapherotrites archaeon]
MPTPKRKRFQIRQRQKRISGFKKARIKYIQEGLKSLAEQRKKVGCNYRTLDQVEEEHLVKFQDVINRLKKRFPGKTIRVLDEGAGESSLAHELSQKGVSIVRSDLLERPFTDFAGEYHDKTPIYTLAKHFGKNKFHLIISTFSGAYYAEKFAASCANIYTTLESGGEAFVIFSKVPYSKVYGVLNEMGIKYKRKGFSIRIFK